MRYLLLADIHANLHALNAVLEDARNRSWSNILLLGDYLGYNACPNQVMECILNFNSSGKLSAAIRGNHDNLVLDMCNPDEFNYNARMAGLWTKDVLEEPYLNWLKQLEEHPVLHEEKIIIVHGSLADPKEYLMYEDQALSTVQLMSELDAKICFNGHTHVPAVFMAKGDNVIRQVITQDHKVKELNPDFYYIVNPGSVGQPRDGNKKASYTIFDSSRMVLEFFRISYDIAGAQEEIFSFEELPTQLALRLEIGL